MGTGYLTVKAHRANEALPIGGAKVEIKDESGSKLYSLVTNSSGLTDEVMLDAPDVSLTYDPSFFGKAYSTYWVEVSYPEYASVIISGVQIFDTQAAMQPVEMHPAIEGGSPCEVIVIPPHQQALREDSRSWADGPFETSRIMHRVIIPDYITVHLGSYTNASARNVRVPFSLYVKNVASSEIYSTWPEASLEANIRAIMNFALNRVYTEWYRGRGYNFDITNSTAQDQYFVDGRDIFASIAAVTDRVMGQYLRRPSHIEPYFTEYCDGRMVSCPGMSQWGTVTLAERGYQAIHILRYYYPYDLMIDTAPVEAITESFPGIPLSQGKQGPDVEVMQKYLNRIGNNWPNIPRIQYTNGVFGTDTGNAVRVFQQVANLPQTGIVDRATWNAISRYYAAVTNLSELTSEGDTIVAGTLPPNTTVQMGNTGGLVTRLQVMLDYLSNYYSDLPHVHVDGAFGSATRNAVVAFQHRFGLSEDGRVGPATWDKLYEVYLANNGNGQGPSIPNPGDPVVRQIQTTLNLRYDAGLAVDGIFGPATKAALIRGLQSELNTQFGRNLALTGTFDAATRAATVNVRPGASGNITYLLQAALFANGHANVVPDGIFGPRTEAAVRQFQRDQGLSADGVIGPLTQERLFR